MLRQMDQRIKPLSKASADLVPQEGWIRALRKALLMTQRQLGDRMHISYQGVQDLEAREPAGTLSLQTMKSVARAMNLEFVYGFVPAEGTLEEHLDNQAVKVARHMLPAREEPYIRSYAQMLKRKPITLIWEANDRGDRRPRWLDA